MTKLDAAYEEDANAANRVSLAVRDLLSLSRGAQTQIAQGAIPSTHALMVKARAVEEAARIWQATRMSVRKAEIDAWQV